MSWCCGQRRGVRRTSRQETRRAASGHFVTPGTVTALLLRRLRSVPRGGSCTRSALEPGVTPCPATAGSPSAPSILSLLALPPLSLSLSPSRPVTRFPAPSCWAARADRYHLGSSGPTRRFPAALRGPPSCGQRGCCPAPHVPLPCKETFVFESFLRNVVPVGAKPRVAGCGYSSGWC